MDVRNSLFLLIFCSYLSNSLCQLDSDGGGGGGMADCSDRGGLFDADCMECIAIVETGNTPVSCSNNNNGCGYYRVKQDYFQRCSSFGQLSITSYESCVTDATCATECHEAYIESYYQYCTGWLAPMCCKAAAFIHRSAAYCKSAITKLWTPTWYEQYFDQVAACVGNRRNGALSTN